MLSTPLLGVTMAVNEQCAGNAGCSWFYPLVELEKPAKLLSNYLP
jgi:hypothetical protein